jgi:hypothetical protein
MLHMRKAWAAIYYVYFNHLVAWQIFESNTRGVFEIDIFASILIINVYISVYITGIRGNNSQTTFRGR